MLMPKKVKHRKQFKGRMTGAAPGGTDLNFGDFGLQATECGWVKSRQIEAARVAIIDARCDPEAAAIVINA